MQSNTNAADQDVPNPPGRASNRLSDTYVIRKTAEADTTEEHCYFCFEDWQIGDGMVRLRCCNHWLHEDCVSKSVLDGRCPTCGIWLASLDDAQVLAGAASAGDIIKVKELQSKTTTAGLLCIWRCWMDTKRWTLYYLHTEAGRD